MGAKTIEHSIEDPMGTFHKSLCGCVLVSTTEDGVEYVPM